MGEGIFTIMVATQVSAASRAATTNFLVLSFIVNHRLYIKMILVYIKSDHITITK